MNRLVDLLINVCGVMIGALLAYFIARWQLTVDAVALYLSSYYSYAAEKLMVNLSRDEETKQFSAEIVVNR